MKFRHVYIVLKKEIKDILRDRKTWIVTLLLPALLLPVMTFFMMGSAKSISEQKVSDIKVAVRDEGNNKKFVDFLKSTGITIRENLKDPKADLDKGSIMAIVVIPHDFEKDLSEGKNSSVIIQDDESNLKSSSAKDTIENLIKEYASGIVKERLIARGIDTSILEPISIKTENVASKNKMAGLALSFIVPMFLTLWAAVGGSGAAIDLAAGEKERGTLEPLLTTSPSRLSIITGKYLAVTIMAMLSAIASLIGLYVSFSMNSRYFGLNSGFNITAGVVWIMILALIFTASMFAALELTLSTYARSFKEGQIYTTPITFLALVPAYMLMYKIPNEIPQYYFMMPVFGTISIFKELLYGIVNITHIGIFAVSSIVYISISVYLAAMMFKQEWALFRV